MVKPHEGLFKPGQSGNPKGKPPGTKNKANLVLQALEARGFDLIGSLVEDAMNNPNEELRQRSKFKLLERISPSLRSMEHSGDLGTLFSLNIQHPKDKKDKVD